MADEPVKRKRRTRAEIDPQEEMRSRLRRLRCDPVAILARLARDEEQGSDIRMRAATTLLDYARPKIKAIDHGAAKKDDAKTPLVIHPPRPIDAPIADVDANAAVREFARRQAEPLQLPPLGGAAG